MNIILLNKTDFIADNQAILSGRRASHLLDTLNAKPGDYFTIGELGGPTGKGKILSIKESKITLKTELNTPPPPPLPVKLILAIPRPKVLKRALQHITTFGVKEIYLIRSWRVEKSYLSSPILEEKNLMHYCRLGLEQAKDTILPAIHFKKLFRPFVEDELPHIIQGTNPLLAHPSPGNNSTKTRIPATLAIGPEGGFIPFEVELFKKIGFDPISLGPRPLRVESAISALLGRLC